MPKLTREKIQELAQKYLEGKTTRQEMEWLEEWYNALPPETLPWDKDATETNLRERLFRNIKDGLKAVPEIPEAPLSEVPSPGAPVYVLPDHKRSFPWRAAAAAVILLAGFSVYLLTPKRPAGRRVASMAKELPSKAADYTRFIRLEDGSTVVLHAGSHISVVKGFSGKTREIELTGEAYFDVAENPEKPFIIHTGKLKTTVLGTAFNIAAYPGNNSIVVAVTHGKVRVEDDKKVLAVLTPDQQVVYHIPAKIAEQEKVDAADSASGWTKQDMSFDASSFASVVKVLGKRYNVTIRFKNPALENCTLKVFFNGTEPLDKVLDVLCTISNSSYSKQDDRNILIDGAGCK